jgi:hypothetical protein
MDRLAAVTQALVDAVPVSRLVIGEGDVLG